MNQKIKSNDGSNLREKNLNTTLSHLNNPKFLLYLKKLLIWGGFFGILFLLRDLFGLVFFTFILGFIIFRINEFVVQRVKVSRKVSLIVLYLILVAIIAGMGYFVGPKIFYEAKEFNKNVPDLELKIRASINNLKQNNATAGQFFKAFASKEQADTYISKASELIIAHLPKLLTGIIKFFTHIVLAIIFSFLILLDLTEVVHELKQFQSTKLRDLYNELARPIIRFAHVVGVAFEAQSIIAICNTVLTLIGMMLLGLKEITFLSIIVFIFSFIPVLGVFISSVPIVIVSFNTGGIITALLAALMILAVHMIEAYVLNPRIYAAHMKLNPVFVLIILFLGHHLFGVWGMLLGVPVIYYFMTYIAGLKTKLKSANQAGIDAEEKSDAIRDETEKDSED